MEQTNNNLDYTNTMSMIRLCMVEGSKRSEHTREWLQEHIKHAKRYHINVTGNQEHKLIKLDLACQCGEHYTIKISE